MRSAAAGASENKPFCDGSHAKTGFDSGADPSTLRTTPIDYAGKVDGVDVTISYTPVLCTHAAECQRRAASVFDPNRKPWVRPENGSMHEITDVMAACPSGALRIAVGDLGFQHLASDAVSVAVEQDGPYHIANIPLDAEFTGPSASRVKYSLCRCGLSKNKPFCDGSHHDEKWSDGRQSSPD